MIYILDIIAKISLALFWDNCTCACTRCSRKTALLFTQTANHVRQTVQNLYKKN